MKNTNNYTKNMGRNAFKTILKTKGIKSSADSTKCVILYGDKLEQTFHLKMNIYDSVNGSALKFFGRATGINKALATDINLSEGTQQIRQGSTLADRIAPDVQHVCFLNEDLIKLSDCNFTITHEVAKQRKIHQCKDCNEYYREACACLAISTIKSYSFKPSPSFMDVDFTTDENVVTHSATSGNTQEIKNAFIGVEWELTKTNNKSRQNNSTSLFKFLKKNKPTKHFLELFQAVKEDGSVRAGFELVTHPFSASYYHANLKSFELMAEHAKKMALKGVGNGIHIHISRDAFLPSTLSSFLKLFHNNSNVLAVLSGRNLDVSDGSGFKRWAKIQIPSAYKCAKTELGASFGVPTFSSDTGFEEMARDVLRNGVRNERYSFLNFNNRATIEYRLPASTTDTKNADYSNFCRHIELMLASFEYSQITPVENVTFESFLAFIEASEKYINLYNAIITNKKALKLILGNNVNLQKATSLEVGTIQSMDMSSRESLEEAQRAITNYLNESTPDTEEEIEERVNEKLNKTKKRGN
jgi:hypothetical protein